MWDCVKTCHLGLKCIALLGEQEDSRKAGVAGNSREGFWNGHPEDRKRGARWFGFL